MLPGHWFAFGKNSSYDDGVRFLKGSQFAKAINCFQSALSQTKDRSIGILAESLIVHCCRRLAAQQIEHGKGAEALKTVALGIELRSQFADLYFLQARAWYLEGNLENALSSINQAIDCNSQYSVALQFRDMIQGIPNSKIDSEVQAFIRSEFDAGNREVALTAFDKATYTLEVEIRKKIIAAQSLSELGQWESALAAWQEIVLERPAYPDVRCQLGQVLLELDRVEEAAVEFDQAILINPRIADAHALKGIAHRRLGNESLAKASFQASQEINPHHPIASQEMLRR